MRVCGVMATNFVFLETAWVTREKLTKNTFALYSLQMERTMLFVLTTPPHDKVDRLASTRVEVGPFTVVLKRPVLE